MSGGVVGGRRRKWGVSWERGLLEGVLDGGSPAAAGSAAGASLDGGVVCVGYAVGEGFGGESSVPFVGES